jgi:hypothetical protein
MDPIIVPKPKGVRNPDRSASALLLAQVQHLREAERDLPPKYQSNIFSRSIRTEGEAAAYIQAVTEAIHSAHEDAAALRLRTVPKHKGVIEIAAVADEKPAPRKPNSTRKKSAKRGRKR